MRRISILVGCPEPERPRAEERSGEAICVAGPVGEGDVDRRRSYFSGSSCRAKSRCREGLEIVGRRGRWRDFSVGRGQGRSAPILLLLGL